MKKHRVFLLSCLALILLLGLSVVEGNSSLGNSEQTAAKSCQDVFQNGIEEPGVFWIKPYDHAFPVYCNQGWVC